MYFTRTVLRQRSRCISHVGWTVLDEFSIFFKKKRCFTNWLVILHIRTIFRKYVSFKKEIIVLELCPHKAIAVKQFHWLVEPVWKQKRSPFPYQNMHVGADFSPPHQSLVCSVASDVCFANRAFCGMYKHSSVGKTLSRRYCTEATMAALSSEFWCAYFQHENGVNSW